MVEKSRDVIPVLKPSGMGIGMEWERNGMWIGIEGILGIGMGKESRNHGNGNWKECKFQGGEILLIFRRHI